MSMIPAEDGNKNPADVERLLALAGPRDAVPVERLQRMRAAVHGAWAAATNQTIDARPRAIGSFLWTLLMASAAAAIAITAVHMWTDAVRERVKAPGRAAIVSIKTGPAERKTLPLAAGGELRVDASSVITIDEHSEIHITKGAIYLDSKGATLPAVITPAGRITDTGTRFEVRMIGGDTRVRVRSGEVRLTQAKSVTDVAAAEELVARSDALDASAESIARRHIDLFGAEWAWVTRAAPRFELEGRSLGAFLDWIEKEGAWTVVFASPALERRARPTELHGSIEHMSTTEALETILPACGLAYRVDLKNGRVIVMRSAK